MPYKLFDIFTLIFKKENVNHFHKQFTLKFNINF
nr:MAG TPA: hypothetical protein [Caudoviricetes sp.]